MKCEHDDHPDGPCKGEVKIRRAMTAYHFTGEKNSKEDPNRDFVCCDEHYSYYVEYWEDMWSNVGRY